ncbi:MAG: translation initiation factor IF-2 N-terminal domain-containing protein, partial [Gammaproteobacteria bacterium]
MPEVTVRQYADVIGVPVERLLEQLQEAGILEKGPGDVISDNEKSELLGFLRRKHGKDSTSEPKKITLRRKSVSEIKVPVATPGSRTRQRSKTVSVEYRKRKTYAKRGVLEEEEARQKALEDEAAKSAAAEAERLKAESEAAADAEAAAIAESEQAAAAAETAARDEEIKAEAQRTEAKSTGAVTDETVVAEAESARPKVAKSPAAEPARDKPEHGKRDKAEKGVFRKELHVASEKSGRRRKKPQRAPSVVKRPSTHAFEMPTAPIIRTVEIPESITVAELAQRMSVKGTEVVKVMMNLGSMVTINQTIDQET